MNSPLKNDSHWRLRYQISLGYAMPIALSIIATTVVLNNVQSVREQQATFNRVTQVEEKIGLLGFNAQTVSRSTRGYLLDQNPVSITAFEQARRNADKAMTDLEAIVVDARQRETLGELKQDLAQLISINEKLLTIARQNPAGAIAEWKRDGGRQAIQSVERLVEILRSRQSELVDKTLKDQNDALTALSNISLLTTGLAVLGSTVLGIWIVVAVSRQMFEVSSSLAASSSEIAATVEQQERTSSAQAASVNETTATMDELSASSRQSAEQAESAAAASQRVLHLVEDGNRTVGQTLESMTEMRMQMNAIAQQISQLSSQAAQIGSITQLVTDVANQTNMLALNAAVEAVRAGEHGKGFSVVAAEIRKLADRSKESAQKIDGLVTEIQGAIDTTVMATEEGSKRVEVGLTASQQTAGAFDEVARAIDMVVVSNQQISLNIRQQAIAVDQVVQAMNALNQGAKQTAEGIAQTRIGTRRLEEAARDLQEMV
ncbi:MAG: methyl-accepting chemotaxis protein [Limnothrix sp.]|nr:methyl-accepting chemotaxis protein [Limnothrix sp.]